MRSVEIWIGKTDDDAIPDRVKVRTYAKYSGCCVHCTRLIYVGMPWHIDHIVALVNGGKHAEDNLQLLCESCHKSKTREDVAIKSKSYRIRKRHLGIQKSKRPMMGSKASGWKKRMDGTVVKR